MKFACNIDKTDRINRALFGALLCVAALLGASKFFYIAFGVILIVEGLIGWCSIPFFISKVKRFF